MNVKFFSLFLLLIALFAGSMSVFVVKEGERALVLNLGAIKMSDNGEAIVYEPGLHFKTPIVDKPLVFDARIQATSGNPEKITTSENKDVIVDTYAKWRVKNFPKFYKSSQGDLRRAEALLSQKVNNYLRQEFGSRTIKEVVSGERDEVMAKLREQANQEAAELGVEVVDVRVKTINLPEQVSESVYARMRTDRQRVATKHRSHGRQRSEEIRAEADANVTILLANADKTSKELRGEGDAEAAKIFATTYSKAPEFFAFVRSLEAYKASFSGKQDIMVMQPEGDFFEYMKSAGAAPESNVAP